MVGRAVPELRERLFEEEQAEAMKPPVSNSELMKKSLKKLNRSEKRKAREELDPMDPAAYSDIPR